MQAQKELNESTSAFLKKALNRKERRVQAAIERSNKKKQDKQIANMFALLDRF